MNAEVIWDEDEWDDRAKVDEVDEGEQRRLRTENGGRRRRR